MNIELRAVETTLGRAAQLLGVRVRLAARFALRSTGHGEQAASHHPRPAQPLPARHVAGRGHRFLPAIRDLVCYSVPARTAAGSEGNKTGIFFPRMK